MKATANSVLRQHAEGLWKGAYAGVALCLFIFAVHARFALPLDPIVDDDVRGYLGPSLARLTSSGFVHIGGLNFLYPGALFVVLRTFGDLRAIAIFQHLLGVAAGVFYVLSWNRLADFLPKSRVPRSAHDALGLLGAGIYLLSNAPILLELRIRSDAVCMFFEMLAFWVVLQFLYHRLVTANKQRTTLYGIAVVSTAGVLASLKPSFTIMAVVMVVPVLWLMIRFRSGLRYQLLFLAASTAAVLALIIPEQSLRRDDPRSKTFFPQTLFAVHAKIIRAQMEQDLRSNDTGRYPPAWLRSACDDLESAILTPHPTLKPFPLLGFHPDSLMKGPDALFVQWKTQLGSDEALLEFLRYYYRRTLVKRPREVLDKIVRQLSVFYAPECPAFAVKKSVPLAQHYCRSLAVLNDPEIRRSLVPFGWAGGFLSRTEQWCATRLVIHQSKIPRVFNPRFARSYRVVLVLSVLAAIGALSRRNVPRKEKLAPLLVLFFYLANFSNTLGISTVHTMQVRRYSLVQFAAALFAHFWAIRWLLETTTIMFKSRGRPNHAPAEEETSHRSDQPTTTPNQPMN